MVNFTPDLSSFKSSAELETLFTSRRLPRAYFLLLEGLLNVTPASRPSCERVMSAIRDGKVCICFYTDIPPIDRTTLFALD
jgi:hypothetical protein